MNSNDTGKDLEYCLSDDKTYYVLEGIGNCKNKNIVIPNKIKGIPVKTIAWGAFYNYSSLESITIPNSVTSIKTYAFNGCSSLKTIIFDGSKEEWKSVKKSPLSIDYIKVIIPVKKN